MLALLRKLKWNGADDSQYVHELSYNDLVDQPFREIALQEHRRLHAIEGGLRLLIEQRAVAAGAMKSALTADEHRAYLTSYDTDISPAESDEFDVDDMPRLLTEYAAILRVGDKYTRAANMHRRSKKRDALGDTAFARNIRKAEGYYERAVMLITTAVDVNPLTNPTPYAALSSQVLRWLDRDVSAEHGHQPDTSATGVPRIAGIKSRYCLVKAAPVSGVRLRKYWRQREALVKASLKLLYDDDDSNLSPEEIAAAEEQLTPAFRKFKERSKRAQQLDASFPRSQ